MGNRRGPGRNFRIAAPGTGRRETDPHPNGILEESGERSTTGADEPCGKVTSPRHALDNTRR